MDEQRLTERAFVDHLLMAACLEGSAGRFDGIINDLGAGGCFVMTPARVAPGESLEIKMLIPTGRWVKIKGEVIYTIKGKGFGFGFVGLGDNERQLISLLTDYAKQE